MSIWLTKDFGRGEQKFLLNLSIGLTSTNPDIDKRTRIKWYSNELADYLLRSYATEEVLPSALLDIEYFTQLARSDEMDYARKRWENAVKYGNLFLEGSMKTIFTDGLDQNIRPTIR